MTLSEAKKAPRDRRTATGANQMTKRKEIQLKMGDVPRVSDVLCICEPRGRGDVTVLANARGRDCLQRVFPEWSIPWEANACAMPSDWLHALFPLPELASGAHRLPPITGDVSIDEATPAALTFLLAIAAMNEGARAVMWDDQWEPQLSLFVPDRAHN